MDKSCEKAEAALRKPELKYAEQIKAYRQEFLDFGGSMDGCGALRKMENSIDWLAEAERYSHRETIPPGRVQSTQFIYVRESDGKIVGMIQVRHYLNDSLEKYAGHIGYSVCPSERRKGYAAAMLRDVLPYCKKIGLKRVMISCAEDNTGSRKTILKNGGVYESTVFCPEKNVNLERYWIDLTD